MNKFIPYIAPVAWESALMSGDTQGLNEKEKEIAERVANALGSAEYRGVEKIGLFMGGLRQICEYLFPFREETENE